MKDVEIKKRKRKFSNDHFHNILRLSDANWYLQVVSRVFKQRKT